LRTERVDDSLAQTFFLFWHSKVMPEVQKSPPKAESLSLSEMMRIMDVATEIRTQRETIEKEFAVDETKRLLREKLLKTTAITGERVTEAEVDAAIEAYFSTLYTYHEPKGSLAVLLARIYVRRDHLAMMALLAVTLVLAGWWTMHIATTKFSSTARANRKAIRLEKEVRDELAQIRALAREQSITEDLDQLESEAKVARENLDNENLASIESRLSELATRLNDVYEVRILADPQQKSGFPRYFEGRPAYYLIVYARNERGQPGRRSIESSETRKTSFIDSWAEQVPKEVYDRIAADKKADGILNETLFSVKKRGFRDEEIRIEGADGKPLTRLGQITEW